jgi:acetyl esterase/lipase
MRLGHNLTCAILPIFIFTAMSARAAQVIPLSADSVIKPTPSDYDPKNPNQDRFAMGSDLKTPSLTYFAASSPSTSVASVIICPGGGYVGEAVDKEGYKPALWLNSLGISAFVLRYRLPHGEAGRGLSSPSLDDLQRAIRLVRSNAKEWGLDPGRVGVMGWSAGGHLAATAGTLFHKSHLWSIYPRYVSDRPDFLVLLYPVITMRGTTHMGTRDNLLGKAAGKSAIKLYSADEQVSSRTPPTFIAVARDDHDVPLENSLLFSRALKAAGVPCELAVYEHGGHGFGMGVKGDDSALWPEDFVTWSRDQGLLAPQTR